MTRRRFTPRLITGERLELVLSEADEHRIDTHGRRLGYKGIVTDQTSGTRYEVYGAACDLPDCCCDAVAYPLDGKPAALGRHDKLRLNQIEARRVQLYTELEDIPNVTMARRRRINNELDNLANEERRIRGEAA